jgi:hypothetical protein
VTYVGVYRKRIGKYAAADIRFLNTNHRWVLNKRVHRYVNGSCSLLETRAFLRKKQIFHRVCASSKHFLWIPLDYISGHSKHIQSFMRSYSWIARKWGFIRPSSFGIHSWSRNEWFVNQNEVSHSRQKTRREDSNSQSRMEWVVGGYWLWAVGNWLWLRVTLK